MATWTTGPFISGELLLSPDIPVVIQQINDPDQSHRLSTGWPTNVAAHHSIIFFPIIVIFALQFPSHFFFKHVLCGGPGGYSPNIGKAGIYGTAR